LLLAVGFTTALLPLHAQRITGTIRGLVSDPSDAVIANAAVTIHNDDTAFTSTVTTNSQGEYVAPQLPLGSYTITVAAPGFTSARAAGVTLHVSSTAVVNLKLQLSTAPQQVTVSTDALQVQTDDATLGEVVNGEQVRELPLNGRNFVALALLQPGVSAAENLDTKNKGVIGNISFSVNGNTAGSNLFLIDGASDNDSGSNHTILINPSIEAISEFKMLRNAYGAEYGQSSGAVINIVTRSGSNQWHGDLLYFGRNDALSAYEYFAHATAVLAQAQGEPLPNGGKDVLRRNDFGYSIGGPIKKDKLFFFLSQEWNIERRGQTRQSCVPTAAERAGNFTTTSCGEPQPTGLVAAGLANPSTPYIMTSLSPGGSLIAAELPLPNLTTPLPTGSNWSQSLTTPIDWSQFNVRLDYNLTHSQTLMFRYTHDDWTNNAPNGNSPLGLWGDDPYPALESNWATPATQVVAKWSATIGTTMVNDLEFAYSNNRINITAGGTDPGLLAQTTAAIPPIWPEKYKTSNVGIPALWGGLGGYTSNNNLWMIAPWNNALDIYTVRDDFSKVIGRHTLRFGGFAGWQGKNEVATATSSGEYPQFATGDWDTSIPTGNNLADILAPGAIWGMGENSSNLVVHLRWRDYELYAADNWKVRPNLTLDAGLRYSFFPPPFQPNNQLTSFRPNLYNPALPATDACNGMVTVPGTTPCAAANKLFGTNFTEASPGENRSLRYANYHLFAPRIGLAWDPTGTGNTAVRAGFGIYYQRERVSPFGSANANNAPFVMNALAYRPLDAPPATSIPSGGATPSGGYDPSNVTANSLQWNLTVQRAFGKSNTLQVGYVGDHAIHQLGTYDVNWVPQSQWLTSAFSPAATVNSLRRFSNWGSTAWWLNNGDANYNSLQVLYKLQLQKFQLQAAYTWSHSIGNVNALDSTNGVDSGSYTWGANPGLDRGNTEINRPQIFVLNAIYYLPDLQHSNAFLRNAVGSWELAGIINYSSGASTTLTPGVSDLAGSFSSLSGSGGPARPLVTGIPCGPVAGPQIFNAAAVTMIGYPIGTLPAGMEPRGYCHGPAYLNTDFSMDKNWRLPGERFRLQFRLDFFNLFNHPNFRADINTGFNAYVNCGPPDAAGNYQPCSPANNVISHQTIQQPTGYSTQTKGARELQYGLKLMF
jgi:hypothetical protein